MKEKGKVRECQHEGSPHYHGYQCYRFDGCRCDVGRLYYARDTASRRKLKALGQYVSHLVDATGSERRVRALMTLGYTAAFIGEQAGIGRHSVYNLCRSERLPRIKREHAESIADLYQKLLSTEAADTHGARYVISLSRNRGYAPPLAWDEDSIDDPTCEPNLFGFRPDQLNSELSYRLAVEMVQAGFQYKEIMLNTGLKDREVYNIKKFIAA